MDWDANGTYPDPTPKISETTAKDKAARPKAENIGEDTQELHEALEAELQAEMTPPSQPYNQYEHFLQVQEENRKRQECERAELEKQVEAQLIHAEGERIWEGIQKDYKDTSHSPTPSPLFPISTPIDLRILGNRFGTISPDPEPHPQAPEMSLGGCHMGEELQQISVVPMEITPGGKHAKAGSNTSLLETRSL